MHLLSRLPLYKLPFFFFYVGHSRSLWWGEAWFPDSHTGVLCCYFPIHRVWVQTQVQTCYIRCCLVQDLGEQKKCSILHGLYLYTGNFNSKWSTSSLKHWSCMCFSVWVFYQDFIKVLCFYQTLFSCYFNSKAFSRHWEYFFQLYNF